jgi:hypothetical protein
MQKIRKNFNVCPGKILDIKKNNFEVHQAQSYTGNLQQVSQNQCCGAASF